jgi:hypothetical protein
MFIIRNLGSTALLVTGSAWTGRVPVLADNGITIPGLLWAAVLVLCLLAVTSFCVAIWGLFTRRSWWEAVALASAALGLLAVLITWIATPLGW